MKRKLLSRHPSPAMVVALIALCSSLAAGATAATLITGKNIKNGTITQKDIKKNAVRAKQVKNGSLLAKDFKQGQLAGGGGGTAVKMARGGARNFTTLNSTGRTQVVALNFTAPSNGFVSLTYSVTVENDTPGTWLDVFLMEGDTRLNGDEWWEPGDADNNQDETQGNHLVVPVTAGAHTYSLRLKMSAGSATAHDARMTALFVPSSL